MVDVEALLLEWLRSRPELSDITFGTERSADLADRLPFVMVTRIGGGIESVSWRGGVYLDRAGVTIQTWNGPDRASSRALICTLIEQLAGVRELALDGGVLTRIGGVAGPTALPNPDGSGHAHRFTATAQVTTRFV